MNATRFVLALAAVASLGVASGCGDRPSYWDTPIDFNAGTYGLTNGVALVDNGAHRVVMLTAQDDLQLHAQSLPLGHSVINVTVSADSSRLFVLCAGDWPRRTSSDELPSLTVIDFAGGFVAEEHRYPMTEPLPNLALDPEQRWAIAWTGPPSTLTGAPSFVENPNQIVIFDLTNPPASVARTLQSLGGTPQRLVFTPELALPGGKAPRRLLLIETDIDVTMLDLNNAFLKSPPPEITVPLTTGATAKQVTPAGIAIDGRNPNDPNDARFAVWASDDTEVFTLQLVAPTAGSGNDFKPTIQATDVGGIPSDVAFVETQGTGSSPTALRVAALVPSSSSAVLLDPDEGSTTSVSLPAPYAKLSLVTRVVGSSAAGTTIPTGTDVALLWNGGTGAASGIALWTFGESAMTPYRSVHVLGATMPITDVIDVPPPNESLKVLQMAGDAGFYVLDLVGGRAPPLTTSGQATLTVAPDGGRLWAFTPGGTDLASVDIKTLTPVPLTTDIGIAGVYDVWRATPSGGFDSSAQGPRALIAMHAQGAFGATVFDARSPDTATSRRVGPLLVEGP